MYSINAAVFDDVRARIPKSSTSDLARRAVNLIDDLDYYTNLYNMDFNLPRILVDVCPDEICFEWIFTHFRIGMLIHEDERRDAWFILGDAAMENMDEKGKICLNGLMRIIGLVKTYGHES